jgi:hypothetical protein
MAYKFRCKVCGEEITTKFLTIGEPAKCNSCEGLTKVPKKAEVIPDSEVKYEATSHDTAMTESVNSGMQAVSMGTLTIFKGDSLIVVLGQINPRKPTDDLPFYEFVDGLITKGYTLLGTSFSLSRGNTATLVKPARSVTD